MKILDYKALKITGIIMIIIAILELFYTSLKLKGTEQEVNYMIDSEHTLIVGILLWDIGDKKNERDKESDKFDKDCNI